MKAEKVRPIRAEAFPKGGPGVYVGYYGTGGALVDCMNCGESYMIHDFKSGYKCPPRVQDGSADAGHPMFHKIVAELKRLHSAKNGDYASQANPLGNFVRTGRMISKFLKPGINPTLASCLSLMSKQVDAVYDMVGEGKIENVESIDDKLSDIALYSIIAKIIIREEGERHEGQGH